jgi:cytochrome c oxidase subunit II
MPVDLRPRRLAKAALTVALTLLAGCVQNPNSVFHSRTDFNREVGSLFALLIWLGTAVFIFTEAMLLWAMWRYRHRPGTPRQPEQVHGNTKLEILWTVLPAVVLAVIAVPTVRTIFKTQGAARADALQIEVIGHQWWWEFHYPEFNFSTANEVYLPIGRTVSFALKTHDVLHSFWIPALGGKRDLVNNRTNHLWFTPDSTTEAAFNGFCAEYCGTSHANMRFRAYTVTSEQFASWVAHQQQPATFNPPPTIPAGPGQVQPPVAGQTPPNRPAGAAPAGPPQTPPAPIQAGFVSFPRDRMPAYTVPHTPIPPALRVDTTLIGDATRGAQLVATGACIGCHTVKGVPTMVSKVGPDLTHIGSRNTIAGGLFPNDARHLTAWVKNSRAMKPGVQMPTMGRGEYDPIAKTTLSAGYTDQQIADIVAYLLALK